VIVFAMPDHLHGYHGRYLRVDLSSHQTVVHPIPAEVLRRFIGGSGLGTWLLLEETPDGVDPLSSEAPIVIVFSPLVGSPLTTSAKFAVLAKSPLTGRINDSLSSSAFAISGKRTGYDAIVVVGAADAPTMLVVEPDSVRFDDASLTWGSSARDAETILRDRVGARFRIAAIGPAGENLVRFATVSHDGRHAGRGGLGAVFGSKKLKAIAVAGDRQTSFADPDRLFEYSRDLSRRSFGPATQKYRELGTVSNLLAFNRLGTLPTRNFQTATFEGAESLAPETLAATHTRTRASCAACTIGCEHIFLARDSNRGVRLEYESLFALGPLCGVSDPDVLLKSAELCDTLGMDTISAGATVAFAMECAERGLIDAPDLRFGNGAALIEILQRIASRSDRLGDLLAHGTRAAAAKIGQGSADFAPHVKGLEIPGYEPRALQTMALGFAVGTRGADHNRSGAYQVDLSTAVDRMQVGPEAALLAIETENEAALMDSLILCKFLRGVFENRLGAMAEMLELVTGWDITPDELRETAERIVAAKKLYNIRQGWTPAEDTLPRRMLAEPLQEGASAGAMLIPEQLQTLIVAYNRGRGWSDEGWIPDEILAKLNITDMVGAGSE
jgi:aldehyde:ferredoxin oxidoreductase